MAEVARTPCAFGKRTIILDRKTDLAMEWDSPY